MSGADVGLAISVFFACAVEAVEALTIVLAVGQTRSWRSALAGSAAATFALVVIVAAAGGALRAIPIDTLRLIVGVLLLLVGLQWLRKAVLRAAGRKALHDELSAFEREKHAALAAGRPEPGWDPYSFTVAGKGVLVEGLEVAIIVVTFGTDGHRTLVAALAAAFAVVLVIAAGFAARAPLARVPENMLKFAVGVMLCSYGVFWGAEGAGASWPGGDAILLAIIPVVLGCALAAVTALRRAGPPPATS